MRMINPVNGNGILDRPTSKRNTSYALLGLFVDFRSILKSFDITCFVRF